MSSEIDPSTSTTPSEGPQQPDYEAIATRLATARGFDRYASGGAPDPAPEPGADPGRSDPAEAPMPPPLPGKQPAPAPEPGAPADPSKTPATPAAAAATQKPEDESQRQWLDRMAKKDAQLHQERAARRETEQRMQALEQRLQQEDEHWRTDPLGALHRRGLSNQQLNERLLGIPGSGKPADPNAAQYAQLPPELQAKLAKLDKIDEFEARWQQQDQQVAAMQAQQRREAQVGTLKNHLSTIADFALLNELDAHGEVFDEIVKHLSGGQFADDEEAAAAIQAIAHRVQTAHTQKLSAYLQKPGVRAFIEKQIQQQRGTQPPASRPPVRPESEDPQQARAVARPQLDSSLASQRSFRPTPDERWDRDEAMRRAIAEASAQDTPA